MDITIYASLAAQGKVSFQSDPDPRSAQMLIPQWNPDTGQPSTPYTQTFNLDELTERQANLTAELASIASLIFEVTSFISEPQSAQPVQAEQA